MNPILVSQSVCCLQSKSSRVVFAVSAAVAVVVMALASASGATGKGFGQKAPPPPPPLIKMVVGT